jgi:two-component system phosphate regulon sensor histidine kinase PhoR
MNHRPHRFRLTETVLLVATVGVAIAGVIGLEAAQYGWTARLATLAAGLCLAAIAVSIVWRRQQQAQALVMRYLERLHQQDVGNYLAGNPAESLPPLPDDHPSKAIADGLRDFMDSVGEQLRHYEHARAKSKVRCRRLSDQNRQLCEILASLNEPVVAVDQFDEVLITNPSADRLFQVNGDRDERRTLMDLVRCEKLVELLSDTRRRKAPAQRTGEIEIETGDGSLACYRVTTRNLSLDQGESPGAPGNGHGAVAVLRELSREKDTQKRHAEFVSAVSHEMKTPLAGIKAYVELLVDGDAEDDETREEFLDVINSQADRLQRLIDNLLNLARIEAGVVEVSKKPQGLNEVLEEALSVVQPAAMDKKIELIGGLSPMYLGVHIDRDMMLQATINLLSNAVKYTPDGGRVTLRSRLHGEHVELEVQDTGVGLSQDDCTRVFEKFYRVKGNRTMARGTGLGLPLAKHIVEDVHGGELTVHSELGAGSTFRIRLPKVEKHD